jgi:hypothetical protein
MVDVNKVSEIGRQAAEQGYETVKEYAGKSVDAVGDVSDVACNHIALCEAV